MQSSINQNFTPWSLLKFAAPSIAMMILMSLYTIVDGIFVSRFVGSNALSALNIVYPVVNIAIAIATMFGTGGNAIISRYLGEGRKKEARETLSQFVAISLIVSILMVVLTLVFLTPIARFLGATDLILSDCRSYLGTIILFVPACMLQTLFQSYLVTAGHPTLGLVLMTGAGALNMIFDYILIVPMHMGVAGAALATGIGQCLPAICGLCFFAFSKGDLHFCHFSFRPKEIGAACYNGSSEMVTEFSNAVITFLFNVVLMRLAGEHGVAAITILLYGQFLFNAFYMGFTIGIAPVVGFQYGAKETEKLHRIYRISFVFVVASSVIVTIAAVTLSPWIVKVFTDDPQTYALASTGFTLFAFNFLFSGVNITSSGFFTALSNGTVSAIISFCRTFAFTVLSLLILPHFLKLNGAWIAVPVAELLTLFVSLYMHRKYFWKAGTNNYFKPETTQ